jgi:hypothetical protein
LDFNQLELLMSPLLMANPAVSFLQLGFQAAGSPVTGIPGDSAIAKGGILFR